MTRRLSGVRFPPRPRAVSSAEEHLDHTQKVGGSIPSLPTANGSEWYAYNMTVNELITKLDLMPADLDVRGLFKITDRPGSWELQDVAISEDGESVSLVF